MNWSISYFSIISNCKQSTKPDFGELNSLSSVHGSVSTNWKLLPHHLCPFYTGLWDESKTSKTHKIWQTGKERVVDKPLFPVYKEKHFSQYNKIQQPVWDLVSFQRNKVEVCLYLNITVLPMPLQCYKFWKIVVLYNWIKKRALIILVVWGCFRGFSNRTSGFFKRWRPAYVSTIAVPERR